MRLWEGHTIGEGDVDWGLMVGWFANAIGVGEMKHRHHDDPPPPEPGVTVCRTGNGPWVKLVPRIVQENPRIQEGWRIPDTEDPFGQEGREQVEVTEQQLQTIRDRQQPEDTT